MCSQLSQEADFDSFVLRFGNLPKHMIFVNFLELLYFTRFVFSSQVLPCQHTFCKSCLHTIVHTHKELRCPECRVLIKQKVDDLPSNILLIRLLDGIKHQQQQYKPASSEQKEFRRHSGMDLLVAFTINVCGVPGMPCHYIN